MMLVCYRDWEMLGWGGGGKGSAPSRLGRGGF